MHTINTLSMQLLKAQLINANMVINKLNCYNRRAMLNVPDFPPLALSRYSTGIDV